MSADQLSIIGSTIADNLAQGGKNFDTSGGNNSSGYGGGLFVANSGLATIVNDDTFSGNTALGGIGGGEADGGAIEAETPDSDSSEPTQNLNSAATGDAIIITNTTMSYNVAEGKAQG